MENLVGPNVQVVLSLQEGTDFNFLKCPLVAVAALNSNHLETDVCECDQVIKFHTELVWETTKSNVRKMRNNMVPIRLDLFKIINGGLREKFGYIVISLKTAQYLPKGKQSEIKDDWLKVMGLGKEAKGCCPQISLSLRIQDMREEEEEESKTTTNCDKSLTNIQEQKEVDKSHHAPTDNVQIIHDDIEVIKPPANHRSPNTVSLTRTAKTNIENYPVGDQKIKKVEAYHNIKLFVYLKNIVWYKIPPNFQFRFHHTRSEISSTAHPEISIEEINQVVELCNIEAVFNFLTTPSDFLTLIRDVPPVISISSLLQNRLTVVAKAVLQLGDVGHVSWCQEEQSQEVNLIDTKTHELVGVLKCCFRVEDCGVQTMQDVPLRLKPPMTNKVDLPPVVDENLTDKIVDELEEWKERQKEIFQLEYTQKLQKQMTDLQTEWSNRKEELEETMNNRIEQCRVLSESLSAVSEDVRKKNSVLDEKEKNLEIARAELESRYATMFREKEEECTRIKGECEEKLERMNVEVIDMMRERDEMKDKLDKNEEMMKIYESELEMCKKNLLSQEQTATLLQDLKTTQDRLQSVENSKLFFKEQWGRAVREIHRIKSEHSKNIQVQLQCRKEELKKLGLEQLCITEKNMADLDRDDVLEAIDFLNDCDTAPTGGEDGSYKYKGLGSESYKTCMDIVKENNFHQTKYNRETEEKLKKLISERDKMFQNNHITLKDKQVKKLNKEIRYLLEQ